MPRKMAESKEVLTHVRDLLVQGHPRIPCNVRVVHAEKGCKEAQRQLLHG